MKYFISIIGIISSLMMFLLWGTYFEGTWWIFTSFIWLIPLVLFGDMLVSTPKGNKILNKLITWLKS